MRRNSNHKVRSTDAVAFSLEGCWAYSPAMDVWEYIMWVEPGIIHCLNEHGDEYEHHRPIEIEAIAPVKVEGTDPSNYLERLAYTRAEAGWAY
jgi:hypothetical protein